MCISQSPWCLTDVHRSLQVMIPTGEISIDTKGLDCLNKFFPSKTEIEAHEAFNSGGGDDDDDEW